MSVPIFLQGKVFGVEEFLVSAARQGRPEQTALERELSLTGRAHWVSLVSEVLPRALLAELNLPKILLGTSGGGQFLLVLPTDSRQQAEELLGAAARQMDDYSAGQVSLQWATTENLGDWSVVRRRLREEMQQKQGTPLGGPGPEALEASRAGSGEEYLRGLALKLSDADSVGWSPEAPAEVTPGGGKHVWSLTSPVDGIALARHLAPSDDAVTPADAPALASRAQGRKAWGVLRGDVDSMGVRLRRTQSIEEYVQLSVISKQFFAGELEVLCSMPEFWRKVSVIFSGGDGFAVYGAWDALIGLGREIHRLFRRFTEENLKDFPGPEGKTLSMAMELAPEIETPLAPVYELAGRRLDQAKSEAKDCFYLLGKTLEWKHISDAADLKDTMARMVMDFGCSSQFLLELGSFYRESRGPAAASAGRTKENQFDKPWRLHRRINRVLGPTRDRELQKLRSGLLGELIRKSAAQWKLRPAGRVALEWARLETEA